jgi:hypothetical protein
MKRKGFKLDVSSSGALADSLDKCVVSSSSFILTDTREHFQLTLIFSVTLGSYRSGLQHSRPHNGHPLYAFRGVLLLGECVARYLWALRARKSHLHPFHESYKKICR